MAEMLRKELTMNKYANAKDDRGDKVKNLINAQGKFSYGDYAENAGDNDELKNRERLYRLALNDVKEILNKYFKHITFKGSCGTYSANLDIHEFNNLAHEIVQEMPESIVLEDNDE